MKPTQLSLTLGDEAPRQFGDLPPGLDYRSEFIALDTEAGLVRAIDAQSWITSMSRRVQHYGWRYDYRARRVDPDAYLGPLPAFLDPIVTLVQAQLGLVPDQAIVNEYLPGQGIAPHVDCEPCFGPVVVMVALGSDAQMDFAARDSSLHGSLLFCRRGLVAITGTARFEWTHAIAKRKSDPRFGVRRTRRLSVTFRTVLTG